MAQKPITAANLPFAKKIFMTKDGKVIGHQIGNVGASPQEKIAPLDKVAIPPTPAVGSPGQIVMSADGKFQVRGLLPGQQMVQMPDGKLQIFTESPGAKQAGREPEKAGAKQTGREPEKAGAKQASRELEKVCAKQAGREPEKAGAKQAFRELENVGATQDGSEPEKAGSKQPDRKLEKMGAKQAVRALLQQPTPARENAGSKQDGRNTEKAGAKEACRESEKVGAKQIGREPEKAGAKQARQPEKAGAKEAGREPEKAGAKEAGSEPEEVEKAGRDSEKTIANTGNEIAKLNRIIDNREQMVRENLVTRKLKMAGLKRKQSFEKHTLDLKHRDEDMTLNKRHRDEEATLENNFRKENEDDENSLASLKCTRNQHIRDFKKLCAKPSNEDTLEAARGTLECPICLEIMKPPTRIWMCPLSHIICEPCKDKLKGGLCPTCTSEKVTLRAFIAENFARNVFNE